MASTASRTYRKLLWSSTACAKFPAHSPAQPSATAPRPAVVADPVDRQTSFDGRLLRRQQMIASMRVPQRNWCPSCLLPPVAAAILQHPGRGQRTARRNTPPPARRNVDVSNSFNPCTTRCVGRIVRPLASIFTNVIMAAASGYGGCGRLPAGRSAGALDCLPRAFAAIIQRCFIAMMAVRDDQFLVLHGAQQQVDLARFGNLPDPMQHPVFIRHFNIRRQADWQTEVAPPSVLDRSTA